MAFTKIAAAGIGSTGTVTLENVVVTGSITASLTGTATSTTNIPNLTGAITSNNTTTSLGSFSSANLATALSDKTGSGSNVFATSPVLVTPSLGIATAQSLVVSDISTLGITTATNLTAQSLVVSGITTLGTVVVGGGTTQLIVSGNARITGILTVGTGSITLDGSTNIINVGTGVTLSSSGINVTGIITATSIVVSAGTAALPSISPSGDSNTGIFFISANTASVSTNGIERLRINSDGNVGIGTSVDAINIVSGRFVVFDSMSKQSSSAGWGIVVQDTNTDGALGRGGAIAFGARRSNGGAFNAGAISGAKSNSTGENENGDLVFHSSVSSTLTERMRIMTDGGVVIGDTTTSRRFKTRFESNTVYSSASMETTSAQVYIHNPDTTTGAYTGIHLAVANNSDAIIAGVRTGNDDIAITFGTRSTVSSGAVVERMRIKSDGSVGIGTTNPSQKVHIFQSAANSQAYLHIENNRSRNAAVQFTTTQGFWLIGQGIGSDTDTFMIYDDEARLSVSGTGSRDVTINTGNLVIGTSGKGIDFSAAGNAAGMTSELLNDYEEGSFTPSITFNGSDLGVVYTGRTGRYTKIGNRVFFNILLNISNKGTATGVAAITGLPFTPGAGNQGYGAAVGADIGGITFDNIITYRIVGGNTSITLIENGGAGLTEADFTNTSQQIVSGHYYVD